MTQEQLKSVLLKHRDAFRQNGVTALYVFGSRARDDNRHDSDLDLFYDLDASRVRSYLDFISLSLDLEEELGFPVQMAARSNLDSLIRNDVEKQAVRIF